MSSSSISGSYESQLPDSILETLYKQHNHWLVMWLCKRLKCPENAADLAQDTFVRLLKSHDVPDMREPKAYLGTIAHGLVIDQSRREKLEKKYLESLLQMPKENAPAAEDHAIVIEALVRLDALLNGLKPRVRTILLLSRLDGMKYREIADQLNISLSTVEKDMALALRHCYQARYAL